MPSIKGQIDSVLDDLWTERLPFFPAQFLTYYRKLRGGVVERLQVQKRELLVCTVLCSLYSW